MSSIVTVHEAKTNLSELLRRVEAGEKIVIARGDKPIAILRDYNRADIEAKRRAGFGSLEGRFSVPDASVFFEPMSADDIEAAFGSQNELFE